MNTLKSRLMSAVAVAALALTPVVAQASWLAPNVDDCLFAIDHITAEASQISAMGVVKGSNIKLVYVEDLFSVEQLADVKADLSKFTTQLELVTLKNTLNNVKVADGANIVLFKDFLNNLDLDLSNVIAIEVLRDGRVLVFGCGDGC